MATDYYAQHFEGAVATDKKKGTTDSKDTSSGTPDYFAQHFEQGGDAQSSSMVNMANYNKPNGQPQEDLVAGENPVTGLAKAAGRGLMEGGASMLETEQTVANGIGKVIHSDVWQGYGELAKKARDFVDQTMPRGEWSGGVVGRAMQTLFESPSMVLQAEMLGGGAPGLAALGGIQGSKDGFGGIMTGAAKGLLNGVLLNASSAIPMKGLGGVLTRGVAGAGVGAAMSVAQGGDVGADALSSGIMSSLSPALFKKSATLASRGLDVATDVVKNTKSLEPFVKFADTVGQDGKQIVANAISFMNPKDITTEDALHLLNNPEYASDKFIKALGEKSSKEWQAIIEPTIQSGARFKIDQPLRDAMKSINMFVGTSDADKTNILSSKYDLDTQSVDAALKELVREKPDYTPRDLQTKMAEHFGPEIAQQVGQDFPKGEYNRETHANLSAMSPGEKAQLINWHDRIVNAKDMSFNQARSLVKEIDHNSKVFSAYQAEKAGLPAPNIPSKEFVRVAKQIRGVFNGEVPSQQNPTGSGLKGQFPVEGAVIDRNAEYQRAKYVNQSFERIRPGFMNVWGPMTFMRVIGLGSPAVQSALLASSSPAAVKTAITAARGMGTLMSNSLRSQFK